MYSAMSRNVPNMTSLDMLLLKTAVPAVLVDLGAYQAITEGMDGMEDYYTAEGGIVTVNTETAEALNIDTAVFKDFGDVVEVTTTED